MTGRERFDAALSSRQADRITIQDAAWATTIERWHSEGLPEGMSPERFQWLEQWVLEQGDIVRTPGTESNVKEIYDRCAELDRDPDIVVFNQFREFGNHLAHLACTGTAIDPGVASSTARASASS